MSDRRLPDYSRVKSTAKSLLKKYCIEMPPVNPVEIARAEGLGVTFVKFTGDFEGASGFFDPDLNAIFVNKDEYPLRQTFTIAHELGHAVLHLDWARTDDYKIFWRDPKFGSPNDPHEKEANAFAANLLVPRNLLSMFYKSHSVEELSRLFAVSVPTIKHRISTEYGI